MTSSNVEPSSSKSDPGPIGLNAVDDMTLAYMVNASQYEKYLKKNHIYYDSVLKRDIRFYRKRIISLTKELFKNQNETDKNQNSDVTMVGAFNMYMRACISYLKFSDQSETIQKCYVCLGTTIGDDNQNQKCVCKNIDENNLFELNKANELCFKPKEVKKITLDNYVIRKNVKKSEPVVYPQQLTFNPRDPAFKHKGLKPKAQLKLKQPPEQPATVMDQTIETTCSINNTLMQTGENNIENIEKNVKKLNEKNEKNEKNKKVSFDITNYIDNI
jgi:hypothetical protein